MTKKASVYEKSKPAASSSTPAAASSSASAPAAAAAAPEVDLKKLTVRTFEL